MKSCSQCANPYPDSYRLCPTHGTPLDERGALAPGTTIRGKYLILERLGSGGMATVYKARHIRFEEIWAVKVISEQCLAEPELVERFHREAAIARKLRHENAVAIQDVDETEDGRPFIAMEYVAGRNLRSVLAAEGPFAPARALHIVAQIAEALAAAHAMGIVHRDIKPDNVMLCASDRVKVLDFGIARLQAESRTNLTRTGLVMGTPDYMSPEQAMGLPSEQIDGRSDIYSLGVMMYELLTGRLPFESDTPTGMLLQHIQAKPQPPHVKRPDLAIPAVLSELLLITLAKDPAERFQSARALITALRGAAASSPAANTTVAARVAPATTSAGLKPTVLARSDTPVAPPVARPQARPTMGIAWKPLLVVGVVLAFITAAMGYYILHKPAGYSDAQPTNTEKVTRPLGEEQNVPRPTATPAMEEKPADGSSSAQTPVESATKPTPTVSQAGREPITYQPAGLAPPPAETIYDVGGEVSTPKLLSAPRPQYTETARMNQVQGEVRLLVIVNTDGTVRNVAKVEQSLPDGLTEQAIDAAMQWRFEPALRFGQPVPVRRRLALQFNLY